MISKKYTKEVSIVITFTHQMDFLSFKFLYDTPLYFSWEIL
jgi:hypothetical protein